VINLAGQRPGKMGLCPSRQDRSQALEFKSLSTRQLVDVPTTVTIPFFHNLEKKNLRDLRNLFTRRVFRTGEYIIQHDSESTPSVFHVIVNGRVRVTVRSGTHDMVVSELGSGQCPF